MWLTTREDAQRPWTRRYILSKNRNLFLENWRRIEETIFKIFGSNLLARTKYFLQNLLLESNFYQISIINLQNNRENYEFHSFTKKEKLKGKNSLYNSTLSKLSVIGKNFKVKFSTKKKFSRAIFKKEKLS